MSEQHVIAFLNKVNIDTALQGRIRGLNSNKLADLINLAKADGFSFTADEWYAVKATAFGQIDDESLDQVAGGSVPIRCNWSPASFPCNGKPASFLCDSFYPNLTPQSTFNLFGK